MSWILLSEANVIPSDDEMINKALTDSTYNAKFEPSIEFVTKIYGIINRKYFLNSLPNNMSFKILNFPNEAYHGDTKCFVNKYGRLIPSLIIFNKAFLLSPHQWVEVIIHEMIHVLDYEYTPEHFRDSKYKKHGDWFMKQAKKFISDGFNIKAYADFDFDDNDEKIKENEFNYFAVIEKSVDDELSGVKILKDKLEMSLKYIYDKFNKKAIILVKTKNPHFDELDEVNPDKDSYVLYEYDDKFITEFGPFYDKEKRKLKDMFSETSDEPEFIKTLRQINGIRNVRKVSGGWEFNMD